MGEHNSPMAVDTNKARNKDSIGSLSSGLWLPRLNLKHLHYGTDCVAKHLIDTLPSPSSKVFVITGTSLAKNTPLIRELETLLGLKHHAGTISNIRQHGPIADVDAAIEAVLAIADLDTIISVGGGSPIDTAKVISLRFKERSGRFLTHIAIPTTLSAAECTAGGGYTKPDGTKVGFRALEMGVTAIFYDPHFAKYTPKGLWLSTAMRAMDHAVECMYHPAATEVPWKALSQWAVREFFECLPRAAQACDENEDETRLRLMLAAFASSGLKGENLPGGMGLSHSLGHALGSPYGIPHGITSCLTLGKVVQLKARQSTENAAQIARLLPAMGGQRGDDNLLDALEVGERIIALVDSLGLNLKSLSAYGVSPNEITTIVMRAVGGKSDDPAYGDIQRLVESLY